VLEALFILLEFLSPSRRIFIGSHSPPSLVRRISPSTSYHAILGRPAIAKFMAVPHYTYLVLKMPSPAGVLSLQGDLKISHDCDTEAVEIASTNQVPNAMMEVYAAS
jgi:hypothetical protein